MPFDGSGNFSRLYSWQADRDNGIHILASRMDGEFDNFAAGMNVVFFRNGLVPMSGNLNMGQNYIVGLGAGSVGALPIRFADDPNSGIFLNGLSRPSIVANGVTRLEANTSGVAVTGTLSATGAITQAGNQVWHAGNLTPGDYMPKSGGTFTGAVVFNNSASLAASELPALQLLRNSVGAWYVGGTSNPGVNTFSVRWNALPEYFAITTNGAAQFSSTLNVNGALTQAGNQVWHAGNFTPSNYAALSGATFSGTVVAPNISANSGTLSAYPAGAVTSVAAATQVVIGEATKNSAYSLNVGYWLNAGQWSGTINAIANSAPAPLNIQFSGGNTVVGGAMSVAGALTQAGNQVWHAGNFNPASYAALSGATFTGQTNFRSNITTFGPVSASSGSGANLRLNDDTGTFRWLVGLLGTPGAQNFVLRNAIAGVDVFELAPSGALTTQGGITAPAIAATGSTMTVSGNQVWHAGNFTPGNYATLASPAFTGTPTAPTATAGTNNTQIATTAFVAALGALKANLTGATFTGAVGRDANFHMDIVGGNPRVTFDSGDYVDLDRTNNKYRFYIGSTLVGSIDAAGNLKVLGSITASTAP